MFSDSPIIVPIKISPKVNSLIGRFNKMKLGLGVISQFMALPLVIANKPKPAIARFIILIFSLVKDKFLKLILLIVV